MKIAAVSEDGNTISQHFGRAPFYIVVTVENNVIVSKEKRDKMGHAQFGGETHAGGEDPPRAWLRPDRSIAACQHGGRYRRLPGPAGTRDGAGAYESMRQAGIQPVVTEIASIDEAVRAYLDGMLVDHTEKLH